MESTTVALLSVIASTLLGGLGLYLGFRVRNQPFRQALYDRQLTLLLEAMTLADSVHTACLRVQLTNEPGKESAARDAAFAEGRSFQALLPKLGVLLPIEIWKAFVDFHEEVGRYLRDNPKRESRYTSITDLYARLTVPVRKFAGVEQLSAENLKAFGEAEDAEVKVGWRLPPG